MMIIIAHMTTSRSPIDRWTITDAKELYGVNEWSAGYFDISETGDLLVKPHGRTSDVAISMMDIISGLKARGTDMPVLLRFGDILESRISRINDEFCNAMTEAGYKGGYRGVYPIKVNQQQHVVEEIMRVGRRYHHGLEVGSKAELIAALAYMDDPEAVLICNGYKDEEFVELALYALKMGIQTILVVEMPNEVPMILRVAEKLEVVPQMGVRVKLSSRAGGHWTDSGGDRSVFGLTSSQITDMIDSLRASGHLHCLKLLHYHLGSQIPSITHIRAAICEACRFYVDLIKEGAAMGMLDVGGGLAVDYDGSHTNFTSSSNYRLHEYCADIIECVMKELDDEGVPHPTILSESGRATVAYHSALLFNVLQVSQVATTDVPETLPDGSHEILQSLMDVRQSMTGKNVQECFHDATFYRDEIRSLFVHGALSLRERAVAEKIFWDIATRIAKHVEGKEYVPEELQGLDTALSDVYYCNFSVFQSLPDAWAVGQLFPIMPVHRLLERPTRAATISDITCDCDGKIDRFIDLHDVKKTLSLHEMNGGDYYLGAFLIGAYQETLGDLHNLLGDTNVVGVHVGENGQIEYSREIEGDSVADVLSYVEYEPKDLVIRLKQIAEASVRSGRITPEERRKIAEAYEAGLRGYTYFEQ
jgi:arginine decarboxylase